VLGPIAWVKEQGNIYSYWHAPSDSPFTYVVQNMFLVLNQRNIAEMGTSVPYADIRGYDWNGSAWTLQYEFKAYILVGILGIVGYAASRYLATIAAVAIIVFNSLLWSGHIAIATIDNPLSAPFGHPLLTDAFNPMLIAPFAFGMLVAIWGKYVPVSAIAAVVVFAGALWTYDHGNWNAIGQYGFLYFLMWAAIRWTRLQHWEKYGDFSYGVYIFAWPLMSFCCYFGLQKGGMLPYFAVIILVTHAIAFCSWHLIEKPAMSLKDWSPSATFAALRRGDPSDPGGPGDPDGAEAVPETQDDPHQRMPALAGVPSDG
jgi:peptidoglycan/LPS O-acetylase OafA/YrhL